ncbi:MAG: hypothetical protein GYB31_13925 [Bacteroidetes bacterium]|nr:hypothetical protein [Bacteroidota bacterium]
MEPRTERKSKNRRQISLILTVVIHTLVLVVIFLPLLSNLDLSDLGLQEGGNNNEFVVQVDQSALGIPHLPVEVEKEEEDAEKEEKEEEAPKEKRAKDSESSRETAEELISNPLEDAVVDAAPKAVKTEAPKKSTHSAKAKYINALGQEVPDSGGGGNATSGPSPSLPGLDNDILKSGFSVQGMDGRYPLISPEIKEAIRENGRVVIRICINDRGEVIRADYTQAGTMASTYLKQLAEANACNWKFNSSSRSLQCGKIVYDFKVQ